jgi:hypothetical protein
MKVYGVLEVCNQIFLTSTLVEADWFNLDPGRFTAGKRAPVTHLIEFWVGH